MDLRVSCGENVLGKLSDPRSIQSSHYYSGCPILAAELGIDRDISLAITQDPRLLREVGDLSPTIKPIHTSA